LRETLSAAPNVDRDPHRALMRIAHRLIARFVAEDRGLLHTADTGPRSATCIASTPPRLGYGEMAPNYSGGRHTDLSEASAQRAHELAGSLFDIAGTVIVERGQEASIRVPSKSKNLRPRWCAVVDRWWSAIPSPTPACIWSIESVVCHRSMSGVVLRI
jgi:hypothetical protein